MGRVTTSVLLAAGLSCCHAVATASDTRGGPHWWFGPPPLSTVETVNVTEGDANVGLATLVRTSSAVQITVNTTELEPHTAYTVWVAAFNDPANCVDDCNGDDLAAADGSVFNGAVFVTGEAGTVNIVFDIETGGLPLGTFVSAGHGGGIRWMNGLHVELHLIVSSHGPSADIDDWPPELEGPGTLPGEQVALFK